MTARLSTVFLPIPDRMDAFWDKAVELLTLYGLRVVGAVFVMAAGWASSRIIVRGIRNAWRRNPRLDPTYLPVLCETARITVLLMTLAAVLHQFGVETASLLTVLGAVGLAIGLALQGSLSNVASGVLILTLRPFRAGDSVEVAGVTATVEEIDLFATRLNTGDNVHVVIPNARIWAGEIRNVSRNALRRVDIMFPLAHGEDVARALAGARRALDAEKRVLAEPEGQVAMGEVTSEGVECWVRAWVKNELHGEVRLSLLRAVKEALDREGIALASPRREITLVQAAPAAGKETP